MKQKLLMVSLVLMYNVINAQVKSTGVVNLMPGMTAQLDLDSSNDTATLTFEGPSDRWFALQFGDFNAGGGMANGEDVVYFNGSTLVDAVQNGVGTSPTNDNVNHWNLISNTVSVGIRTIVATRPFNTGENDDYVFDFTNNSISFAFAKGNSAGYALAYHGAANRGYAINNFVTLGLDDYKLTPNSVKLVPNPAISNFHIYNSSMQVLEQVSIYNASGQEVMLITHSFDESIDISHLSAGIYYVQIKSNVNEIATKKLIVR